MGRSTLRSSLLCRVTVFDACVALLYGPGIGAKDLCQPQEGCNIILRSFPLQDLELLYLSDAHREEEGDLGPIKSIDHVLPSLNCTQLSRHSRCHLVYLFFVHPRHHGTESAEMIGRGLVAVRQALKHRSQLSFVDVAVGLHRDFREVVFGVSFFHLDDFLRGLSIVVEVCQRVVSLGYFRDDQLLVAGSLPLQESSLAKHCCPQGRLNVLPRICLYDGWY